jgi:hypothetical protein
MGDGQVSAAACSGARPMRPFLEKLLRELSLWEKRKDRIMTLVRRHEAARDDRQGAVA